MIILREIFVYNIIKLLIEDKHNLKLYNYISRYYITV